MLITKNVMFKKHLKKYIQNILSGQMVNYLMETLDPKTNQKKSNAWDCTLELSMLQTLFCHLQITW
jgi:hypothetical protein